MPKLEWWLLPQIPSTVPIYYRSNELNFNKLKQFVRRYALHREDLNRALRRNIKYTLLNVFRWKMSSWNVFDLSTKTETAYCPFFLFGLVVLQKICVNKFSGGDHSLFNHWNHSHYHLHYWRWNLWIIISYSMKFLKWKRKLQHLVLMSPVLCIEA